uniref:RNase H type-1 domain-containing protein n=1 Tax=Timema poppense TaxID=170557 RepID=A0A7R9DH75_TIMPO|nr:unnamed protein product [Timema poppensis]
MRGPLTSSYPLAFRDLSASSLMALNLKFPWDALLRWKEGSNFKFRLPEETNVFTAELYAIFKSLCFVYRNCHCSVHIFTDSMSALLALSTLYSWNPLVQMIYEKVLEIVLKSTRLAFYCILGHTGLSVNELADQASKEAVHLPPEVRSGVMFLDLKDYVRCRAELVSESNPGPENNDKGADVVELEGGSEVRKPPPKLPPIPQSVYKPPREIPPEKIGIGANKKVYFVCNNPGDDWTMLPDVTPQQINVARQIKKYFTGDLNTEILTYPPFPGTEMNYLRAQIARISAGTQVSPLGFYYFDEEEEEDEEEEFRTSYVENPDFEPVPLKDLLDKSMSFWVHHTLYILKQGRTTWWSPKSEEEAEEEEEEELENVSEEEVGPPILTPLSEDATLESVPPWTVRISSQLMPDFAVAVLRSNLWPGAHTFATGRKFENVYFGWGHKYTSYNYSPPTLEATQKTYPLGPEIMEMEDPTPEEEEAWRIAHEPKPEVLEEEQEEEEDMEEENEDDDDED